MKLKHIMRRGLFLITCLLFKLAWADVETELAKATQNPLARNPETKYFSYPFTNDLNFNYGSANNTQDILYFKPILPFKFTGSYDLILRPILPIYHQPSAGTGTGMINGYGDLNPTAFISPAIVRRELVWGIGPSLFIPTATNQAIGSGKWSIGPQLALFTMPYDWVLGILTSNVWSFAGDSTRKAVDQFSFQYFISYNFPKGWYITSQPTITANWKLANKPWTIPVGVGFGRSFHYNGQAMDMSLQSFYNIVTPSSVNSKWTLQAKINFLFPA